MARLRDFEINETLKLQTLKAVLEGKSTTEMANLFDISEKGVKWRLANLYKAYGVKNKFQLMAKFVAFPEYLENLPPIKVNDKKTPKTPEEIVSGAVAQSIQSNTLPVGNGNKFGENLWT